VRDNGFVPRRLRRPQSLAVAALLRLGLPAGTRHRVAERPPAPLWPDLEAALHTALDPDVEALRELVPELDVTLWPNFAHLGGGARPSLGEDSR
jgi:hypothetical protein